MTTGKNKEQFKEFYDNLKGGNYKIPYKNFMAYPFEMQTGVYLAYYDSLDIIIIIDFLDNLFYSSLYGLPFVSDFFKTRNEAYKEAFKEADIKVNNQLNK